MNIFVGITIIVVLTMLGATLNFYLMVKLYKKLFKNKKRKNKSSSKN